MSSLIVEVCRILDIQKHPNADRLSIAKVKGFHCIVGLDEYKVDDLVVYIPPDAVIPDAMIEQYELTYLKSASGVSRTKTIKLRGAISEGLILPVPMGREALFKEGEDIAGFYGITKYEPPQRQIQGQPKRATKAKLNPLFDKYSDLENIKHYPEVFSGRDHVVITEKIHGSNFRAGHLRRYAGAKGLRGLWGRLMTRLGKGYEFVYGSHNVQISGGGPKKTFYGDDIYGRIAKKYNLKDVVPPDFIIYGEVFGKGVQDLTYGLDDIELAVFDIKYVYADGTTEYQPFYAVRDYCEQWGLKTVPLLYEGWLYDAGPIEQYRDGKTLVGHDPFKGSSPTQIREGCVISDYHEETDFRLGRKKLKCISPAYLLRKGGTEFK